MIDEVAGDGSQLGMIILAIWNTYLDGFITSRSKKEKVQRENGAR
jgi:hypothetical protein